MAPRPPARPVPVRGPARLLRGWAAAIIATLVAAGSHTVAVATESGPAHPHHPDAGPAPVIWILTLALAGPLCTALAGRRLSWGRLAAGVGASQLLFHRLYSASAPAGAPVLAESGSAAGHAGHGAIMVTGAGPGSGMGQTATESLHAASPVMVTAHVVAAVGTVLLLRRGELLAARVAELAVGLILRSPGARVARWIPAAPPRRVSVRAVHQVRRPDDVLLPSLRLRGPPEAREFALAA